jgi:hypothetical protein
MTRLPLAALFSLAAVPPAAAHVTIDPPQAAPCGPHGVGRAAGTRDASRIAHPAGPLKETTMTIMPRRGALGAALALAGVLAAMPAAAHDYSAGDLTILHPWTRAAGAEGNGAGFLRLRNGGAQPDRLLSAATPAARVVELHTMERDGDVMRMRPVRDILVAPGATVELRPGGFHIMLIGLTAPMAQGGRVPLTLRFERAGEVQVELAVEAAGARGSGHRH